MSLWLPPAIIVLGCMITYSMPLDSGDWLGRGLINRIATVIALGSAVAVVLSILSIANKEPKADLSIFFAAIGGLYLIFYGALFVFN